MKSKFSVIAVAVMLLCSTVSFAQSSWDKYSFATVFTISIPPSLELRDPESAVGRYIDNGRRAFSISMGVSEDGNQTVFWPGLASDKYARIMVKISPSEITQEDMRGLSSSDINQLDAAFKSQNVQMAKMAGSTITWLGTSRELYGGRYALRISYERPGLEGTVRVDQYKFYTLGKEIYFTVSYRKSESYFWKDDLDKTIRSIVFSK